MDWAMFHQYKLLDDWDRAALGEPLVEIRPLDQDAVVMLRVKAVKPLELRKQPV